MTHNQNEHSLKKRCAVLQVCVFFFKEVDFLLNIVCTLGLKSIFGYCNLQTCNVIYATVKYLLYHLHNAKDPKHTHTQRGKKESSNK